MSEKSKVYFKLPNDLILEDNISFVSPAEFTLTIKGTIFDYVEAGGRIFWLLEENFEDIRFELRPIKNAIVE